MAAAKSTLSPCRRRILDEEKVLCHQLAAILLHMAAVKSTVPSPHSREGSQVNKKCCVTSWRSSYSKWMLPSLLPPCRRRISGKEKMLCHLLAAIFLHVAAAKSTLSPFQRRISGEEKVLCHQLAAILLNMTSGISTLFLFQRRISGEVKVLCHLLVAILLHMTAAKSTLSTFRRRISGEEKVLCHMLVAILRTQHGLCQVYPLPIPQRDLRWGKSTVSPASGHLTSHDFFQVCPLPPMGWGRGYFTLPMVITTDAKPASSRGGG